MGFERLNHSRVTKQKQANEPFYRHANPQAKPVENNFYSWRKRHSAKYVETVTENIQVKSGISRRNRKITLPELP